MRRLPLDRPAEERLARQRVQHLRGTRNPRLITVEVWLRGCAYRMMFPDERGPKAKRTEADMVRQFCDAFSARRVWDITALEAQAWALEHPSHVRFLRRAWRKARLMGAAEVNVWEMVELPRRVKEKVRAPSPGELAEIVGVCERLAVERRPWRVQGVRPAESWWYSFRDLIEVAAYSGAREGGLIGLRREDVDLEAGRLTVTEKGEKTREVVLCGPSRAAMERQVARRPMMLPARLMKPEHRVFLSSREGDLSAKVVQSAWGQVRGEFPHGFHSLKHFCATWLIAQGADELDVAVQLGHLDAAGLPYRALVDRVYNNPDAVAVQAAALERIERLAA